MTSGRRSATAGRVFAARVIALGVAVLGLAAWGTPVSADTVPANTVPANTVPGATTIPSPAATIPGCKVGVWADNFTDAGHLAWQVSLPVPAAGAQGQPLSPLAVDGVAVFADGNTLYARRQADGKALWHAVFPNASNTLTAAVTGTVDGIWGWKGSVIALLGADSAAPSLASVNAATGKVRWRIKLGGGGLSVDSPMITGDGVAAILTQNDAVRTFDLSTGKALWSRVYLKDTSVTVAGTILVIGAKPTDGSPSTLHGVVARTGHTLWTRGGQPSFLTVQAASGGRLLVNDDAFPAGPAGSKTAPLVALSAATGQTLWHLQPPGLITAIWPSPAGVSPASVLFATGDPGTVLIQDPAARLSLADAATGKVRWSVKGTHSDPYTTPIISATYLISVATTPATGTVIDRAASTGAARWGAVITDTTVDRFLAKPSGPDVLVTFPAASESKPSRLLSVDVTTGKAKATVLLPFTASVGSPLTVVGGDALAEPTSLSCAVPVHP
jgi:outer membrane protein assembly factor BamB